MSFEVINPTDLGRPKGYSNGLLALPGGRILFVAGQIGWDEDQKIVGDSFVDQFDRALLNVIRVVQEAGGSAANIGRMVIYVTDKREYSAERLKIGECWRARMGKHFPAMALVEVKSLLEDQAKVEIEAIAVIHQETS
jgi:enamine deaminase RidA (YjgF/YER057c/UK114 family)